LKEYTHTHVLTFVHPKKQNDQCDRAAKENTAMTKQHVVLSPAFEERLKNCSKNVFFRPDHETCEPLNEGQ